MGVPYEYTCLGRPIRVWVNIAMCMGQNRYIISFDVIVYRAVVFNLMVSQIIMEDITN